MVFHVKDKPCLLVIEELPHLKNDHEMLASHFIEVSFQRAQFFLVLLFEDFEVKAQKSLHFGRVFGSEGVDVVKQIFECLE